MQKEVHENPIRDDFHLSGFVTRHQLSLAFEDWRILSELLAWLISERATLVYMLQRQSASVTGEACLLIEGVSASCVSDWMHRARANGQVTSARLEHLLTAINVPASHLQPSASYP